MKTLISILLLCFVPAVVAAAPLKVVNVSAPAINCVFNPGCTVTVNDTTDNIMMSTGGTGFLQARTYMGAAGSPAAGLYAYEYRIDLRNAVGAVAISFTLSRRSGAPDLVWGQKGVQDGDVCVFGPETMCRSLNAQQIRRIHALECECGRRQRASLA